jgi:hypothetical protein
MRVRVRVCVCVCMCVCVCVCVCTIFCPIKQLSTECMISITTSSTLQKYKPPINQEKLDIISKGEAIPYVPQIEKLPKNVACLSQL